MVGLVTVLDSLHPALHSQGDLARLLEVAEAAVDELALPADLADGADNGGGTRTKGLNHAALGRGLGELLHGVLALNDVPALGAELLAGQGQDGVAGDALEDGAVERGGEELLLARLLVLEGDEHVHGADLGDVLLLAKEPQVLLEAAAGGLELGQDAGGVVGAELLVADAAGPGAHGVVGGLERDGLEARGVVGADGTGDDVQQGAAGRANSQSLLRANHGRAEVERVAALVGNELLLELGELGNQLNEGGGLKGGQGDAGRGLVEALHVLVWAEEAHIARLVLVGLHALEALKGIVEDTGGGVEREVLVRCNLGLQPTVLLCPFYREHVFCLEMLLVNWSHLLEAGPNPLTCEFSAKHERLGVARGPGRGRLCDAELCRVDADRLRSRSGLWLDAVASRSLGRGQGKQLASCRSSESPPGSWEYLSQHSFVAFWVYILIEDLGFSRQQV